MNGKTAKTFLTAQSGVNYVVTFAQSITACADLWLRLEKDFICSPYQRIDFCRSWLEAQAHSRRTPCTMLVSDAAGIPLLFIPFVIEQRQGIRLAAFMGGTHLNFSVPLFRKKLKLPHAALINIFSKFAKDAQIDAFYIDKIPRMWENEPNPLFFLPHRPGSEKAYRHKLSSDLKATLKSMRSSSHLKQLRSKQHRLEDAGPARITESKLPRERAAAVKAFFVLKSAWCRREGLPDVFAEKETQRFIKSMASAKGSLRIFTLRFSGAIRAVFLGLQHQKCFCGWASSYELDALDAFSPGDLLLQYVIATACKEGFEIFDLGAGDAAYKARWLHEQEPLHTAIFGYGWKGRALAQILSLKHAFKHTIKKSPQFYRALQKLRA